MTQRHVLCTGDAKGIYLFLCVSVLFCFCCLYQCGESVKQCAKDEEEEKGGRGERKRRRKKCEADTPHNDTQTTTPNSDQTTCTLTSCHLSYASIDQRNWRIAPLYTPFARKDATTIVRPTHVGPARFADTAPRNG